MKRHWLSLVLLLTSAVGLLPMKYGYYIISRLIFSSALAFASFRLYQAGSQLWMLAASLVVLYNPIIPIHLGSKGTWAVANFATLLFVYWLEARFNIADKSV